MDTYKLISFLNQLEKKRVITAKASRKIQDFLDYGYRETGKLFLVFTGIIGALFASAGVFAIISHNWDDFPKLMRGILSIVPSGVALYFYYLALFKHKSSTVWMESATVFLFLMIGASIALISNTYQLDGDFGKFLKVWLFLSIPLFYLGRASGFALLYLGLSCYFVFPRILTGLFGIPSGFNHNDDYYWFWIFFIAFLPHFLMQLNFNSKKQGFRVIYLGWLIAILFYITLPFAFRGGWIFWAVSIVLGYLLIGQRYYSENVSIFGKPFQFIVWFALFYTLIIISNADGLEHLFEQESLRRMKYAETDRFVFYFLGLAVMIGLTVLAFKKLRSTGVLQKLISWFPLLILFLLMLFYIDKEFDFDMRWIGHLILNFYILGFGLSALIKGANEKKMLSMFYGLFLICWLLWVRYFDLDWSFWLKGLVFLMIGGGFFLIAYIFKEELIYEESTKVTTDKTEEE